jgi:hypothetical protein
MQWSRLKPAFLIVLGLALLAGCAPTKPTDPKEMMPVYRVADSSASREGAPRLAAALSIDAAVYDDDSGVIDYLDLERFQSLPTVSLGRGESGEDGDVELVLEAIDREALARLQPVSEEEALARFDEALRAAGLHPDDGTARSEGVVQHGEFEVFDEEGESQLVATLDTRVDYRVYYGEFELKGPGARVSATFDSEGMVTQLRHSLRAVTEGEAVPVISADTAGKRCSELLGADLSGDEKQSLAVETGLVYYAPELSLREVEVILPHYECGGTTTVRGERVHLLRRFLPAVDEPRYSPTVAVTANAKGNEVTAKVEITGGRPPYSVDWSSSSTAIAQSTGEISYDVAAREETESSLENLQVVVTDANGIWAQAVVAVQIEPGLVAFPQSFDDPDVDFGTENAVTNEFGDLEQGFIDEMSGGGVVERFSWSGLAAWERDFKANWDNAATPYPGVDQADIVFYVGHGYGGGFTFENTSHQDGTLSHTDADGDWGNRDSEWMALLSCQVLRDEYSGLSTVERWRDEFDGLHLLMGFHTNAYAYSGFSGAFADNMLNNGMTVRQAWFSATQSDQPSGVTAVVMGPLRISDWVSDYNDYFHLRGPHGPDLRGPGRWFWRVSYTKP